MYQCFRNFLKGQSNEIFDLQFFLNNSNMPVQMQLTNRFKYFRFWLRICWVIRILSKKIWLPRVSYPGESISPGYHTPASQSPRGIIPQPVNKKFAKTWLPGVWYPGESISPGIILRRVSFLDTKVRITWQNLNQNRKYLNPLISGQGWFEWWLKLAVENLVGLSL